MLPHETTLATVLGKFLKAGINTAKLDYFQSSHEQLFGTSFPFDTIISTLQDEVSNSNLEEFFVYALFCLRNTRMNIKIATDLRLIIALSGVGRRSSKVLRLANEVNTLL